MMRVFVRETRSRAQNELENLAKYGLIHREENNGTALEDGSRGYVYSKDAERPSLSSAL